MKNQLFVFIFFGLLISSCGTTNHYATSSYDDAIYYNPHSTQQITQNYATNDELQNLKEKTKEAAHSVNQNKVQAIIYVDNDTDTSIVLNNISYEELLTKFDSPYYVINTNVVDGWTNYWDNPYWSYGYYNPWYYGYNGFGYGRYGYGGYGWYSPFYSYWDSPWYNPWLGVYGYNGYYGYYGGFYGGYYGGYYGGFYDPWYNPGGGNGQYNDSRGNFYGRRVNTDDGRHRDGNNAISGGSYIRKDVKLEQIRGGSLSNSRTESSSSGRSGSSMYKRDPGSGVSGAVYNTDVVRAYSGTNTNRGSSYQRSVSNVRQSSGNVSKTTPANSNTPVYRKSTQSTSNNTSTGNSTYQRNPQSSGQSNYNQPIINRSVSSGNSSSGSVSSGSMNTGSSGGGERSSSGSGGSVYRR